jgi:hypothetical protein
MISRMPGAIAAVVAIALTGSLPAAEPRKERPSLPPQLEAVYGLSLGAPPEFAARALLHLSTRVSDKGLRRDLVEMAFRLASSAQHPFRTETLPAAGPDTRSASLSQAMRLGLDALSLRTQAIEQMLAIDKEQARRLFAEIEHLQLPAATCEQSLLADVSPYYIALAGIVQSAFTAKERASAEHVGFTVAALGRISSIRELAPSARFIASLGWPRGEFEIALGAWTSKLESMPLDSRSFMASANAIDEAVAQLVARARQFGTLTAPLTEAYRSFLVAQFGAPRCSDAAVPSGRIVQDSQRPELFGEDIRGDLPPLSSHEMAPETVEGSMTVERYWQSEPAQRIFQECLKLRTGPNGISHSEADRRGPEWTRQLIDFLNVLAGWKASDESSDADYFHQKAIVYEMLLELAPPGDSADRIQMSYISFLRGSTLEQRNPVEWFSHAQSTLNRVRSTRPGEAPKLAAAYRASGSIILALESMLEELPKQ